MAARPVASIIEVIRFFRCAGLMEVAVKLADRIQRWAGALQGTEDPRGDGLRKLHEDLAALACHPSADVPLAE